MIDAIAFQILNQSLFKFDLNQNYQSVRIFVVCSAMISIKQYSVFNRKKAIDKNECVIVHCMPNPIIFHKRMLHTGFR